VRNKYGVFQSTATSCVFYKQDEDGNQSTFNIFVEPKKQEEKQNSIFAFIDNEQIQKNSWFGTNDLDVDAVIEAFRKWASDAPFLFGLDAQKSINQCFSREIRTTKIEE
jgi:hypothetical protein